MKSLKFLLSSCMILALTGIKQLYAHPGHGSTDGHSIIHYLSEPMHAMVLVAVIIMIASSVTWFILRKKKKQTADVLKTD